VKEVSEVPDFDALAKLLVYYSLSGPQGDWDYSVTFKTRNPNFFDTFPEDALEVRRHGINTFTHRLVLGPYVYDIVEQPFRTWEIIVRRIQ
jgi:hypothetical protein